MGQDVREILISKVNESSSRAVVKGLHTRTVVFVTSQSREVYLCNSKIVTKVLRTNSAFLISELRVWLRGTGTRGVRHGVKYNHYQCV